LRPPASVAGADLPRRGDHPRRAGDRAVAHGERRSGDEGPGAPDRQGRAARQRARSARAWSAATGPGAGRVARARHPLSARRARGGPMEPFTRQSEARDFVRSITDDKERLLTEIAVTMTISFVVTDPEARAASVANPVDLLVRARELHRLLRQTDI